jgi:hypothetical protein
MKKFLFNINIFLCLLLLLHPSITAGEENQNILKMEELSIKVMPEFAYHPNDVTKEHPPLLIGYQGTMRNQSAQPQKGQIEIPLPMTDKNFRIGYVADYSSDLSKVYEIEYILDQEKETISWTTSEDIQPNDVYKFVIEFYTDTIMPTVEMMAKQDQPPMDTLENKKSPAILSIAAVSGIGLLTAGAFAFLMKKKREKR